MAYSNIQSSFISKFDNWKKLGVVISPQFKKKWMKSHTAVPVIQKLSKNSLRIFFCIRDKKNMSHIVSYNFDINKNKIIKSSFKLELKPGKLGEFDENGVTATWLLNLKKKLYLYYVGWRPSNTVRFSLFSGLAIKKKNSKSFKKIGNFPILERSKIDPFLTATLSIIKEKSKLMMWYVSGEGWIKMNNGETLPKYNIKYSESIDGLIWKRNGDVSIDFKSDNEFAIARPSVIKLNNIFYMWYCYKAVRQEYRIGFAVSKNGKKWKRMDKFCKSLNTKRMAWESQMLAYPHVIKHKNKLLMFYNGNGYGKTGIGLATLNLDFLNIH